MRKTLIYLAGFAVAVATLTVQARAQRGGTAQAPPADLVLTNGRIVTVDDGRPEAEAIAISKDRIQALGTAAEIKAMIGPNTQVIDLQGQLAIPGFIESHGAFRRRRRRAAAAQPDERGVVGQGGRDGRRGGVARAARANGSTAAAGTRRNGRRVRRCTSRGSRRTRRSTRCRRTIRSSSCTRAGTRRSPTARRWSCRASAGRPRARLAARFCVTRPVTPPASCARRRSA